METRRSVSLILFMLIVPGAIAELLSGSSPPVEFFNPVVFLIMSLLYGCGALLVREAKVAWRLGWVSVAILGAAYGILEEGLCCKSFFDPDWADLGESANYVRYGNTAWFWAIFLTFFHSFISICIPILLSELVFPTLNNQRLLGRKGVGWTTAGISVVTLTGFAFFPDAEAAFRPPVVNVIAASGVIIALVLYAKKLGGYSGKLTIFTSLSKKFRPTFLGFITWTVPILLFFIIPNTGINEFAGLAILLLFMIVSIAMTAGMFSNPASDLQKFGFILGVLIFFIILAILQETDNASRPDNTTGLAMVGLAAFGCMMWVRSIITSRQNSDTKGPVLNLENG